MNREYDILMSFSYFDDDYVLYTDNTYDSNGSFNVYGARVDSRGRLKRVDDVDMDIVFNRMIEKYRNEVLKENV
jgi:hypothetical protein